jgi:DNA-binding transcriptional regulator YhcF (GntR family)
MRRVLNGRSRKKLPNLAQLRLPKHSLASRGRLISKLLRRLARQARQAHAIRFYSIRAVATRFRVSPSIISRHYQQLQSEGLLTTIWGSKTMIPALARFIKKGAYVIPISVTELAASEPYRNYVLNLHRRLRSRGIAEHLILFESVAAKASVPVPLKVAETSRASIL